MIRVPLLALCLAGPAVAQSRHEMHGGAHHPYAGQDSRAIAALSEEHIAGLQAGAGLGYAKAAELNGWPGPLHVLELADELDLSPEVQAQVEALRQEMLDAVPPLGLALIAAEEELDHLFDRPDLSAAEVEAATTKAAAIEAKLRAAHLVAHLKTAPLLTPHQRMLYASARGYETHAGHHADPMAHGKN
ncbi:Spy/CpxP family protein refolding chaperone [Arenibacterium sp. LLYu02]|uniref:Spy/CpxP family protein refolding chaperone n=1 Tax=Arenibacterium sp. LLYu02 TaxID=3404132 RepID=UPI003B226C74